MTVWSDDRINAGLQALAADVAKLPAATPLPDEYVMACRCCEGLRPGGMHWFKPPRPVSPHVMVVRQVCCLGCAVSDGHIGGHDEAGAA